MDEQHQVPTERMVVFAEELAKQTGGVLPVDYKENYDVCSAFINENVNKPRFELSPKQRAILMKSKDTDVQTLATKERLTADEMEVAFATIDAFFEYLETQKKEKEIPKKKKVSWK